MMLYLDNRWVQVGIVSFGNKCAEPGFPGVFTRLTKFMDWIDENTPMTNIDVNEITTAVPLSTSLKPIRFPDEPTTTTSTTTLAPTSQPAESKPEAQKKCGQVPAASLRIVGGNVAQVGAWPWMAAIFLHNQLGEQFWCGGSLINGRYVLTAAHCTQDGKQRRYSALEFSFNL
jgi:secreted trypsin-like serine protease